MTSMFEIVNGHKLRKKVRAVIENEQGQFLLIQPHGYDSDAWTLVGGGVELNESNEQAILREIREETGIDGVIRLQISKVVHWFCFSDKIKRQRQLDHDGQIAKVFFAIVPTNAVVLIQQSEIQAFIWASPKEAEGLIKNLEQRNLFKEIVTEFRDNRLHRLTPGHPRRARPRARNTDPGYPAQAGVLRLSRRQPCAAVGRKGEGSPTL